MQSKLDESSRHACWTAGYKAKVEGMTLPELIVRWQNDPRAMRFSVEQWQAILDGFNGVVQLS